MNGRYRMIIEWSDEDNCFIASLPDFGPYAKTHGDSYLEAAKNGQEVIESLIESYSQENKPLPSAALFGRSA